jgi:ubiquinone/menaquinone biosynthesis C-methylase UbiE
MPEYIEEGFKPIKNEPPTTIGRKIKFYGRMLLDLQILTIYQHIKKELPELKGKVLDVGCGQSPYKFLLNTTETEYKGIDVIEATSFDYVNKDITLFDGENIPFEDNTFDAVICTEVLEHAYNHQKLVDEMYRVCKPHAKAIITIPFSTRYHYIPHDYFRYTPSALKNIFAKFSTTEIIPRGTDITSICAKIIVLFSRNVIPNSLLKIILLPLWILFLPFLAIIVLLAHVSLLLNLGSNLDPLGYTIKITK